MKKLKAELFPFYCYHYEIFITPDFFLKNINKKWSFIQQKKVHDFYFDCEYVFDAF